MPRYDSEQFDPPAPVADVTLRNPRTRESISDIKLLLDSRADVTLLPRAVVNRLGLVPESDQRYGLAGFDGQHSFGPTQRFTRTIRIVAPGNRARIDGMLAVSAPGEPDAILREGYVRISGPSASTDRA